eukprot:CAMPEP_0113919350 /NCGR_PEP_ID=MMETSP0780_2-20120614/33864_1 /TAXON_ID=652834 /ORGANISM="Palpitomonas bilix" /LENGTH=76 /DNA_ID=CAMNT_0000919271 /DNA_START=217 /DNA_END=447 /DNA_ORIENTATION=- /assembly_acc=CAM_ASM_000599
MFPRVDAKTAGPLDDVTGLRNDSIGVTDWKHSGQTSAVQRVAEVHRNLVVSARGAGMCDGGSLLLGQPGVQSDVHV